MDVLLFEYLPPIAILIMAGVLSYYFFKLLYLIIEEIKHAKTITGITDIILFILATLVLSIIFIFMLALAIECVV